MDITNTIRKYVECASSGAITSPTDGSWIGALAIWQGSSEPVGGSWLQTVCLNFGIAAPVNGSWLQALANHYGEYEPVNGSWSNAVLVGCEGGGGVIPFIWDQDTNNWESEDRVWNTGIA